MIYDKFFTIKRIDGSFKDSSPFVLYKSLQSYFGTLCDTKKLYDGSLLIEVSNEKQSFLAVKLDKLNGHEVTTAPHKSLNIIKGVVNCSDFVNCSDEEILENLKDQGVVEVKRIPTRNESGKSLPLSYCHSSCIHSLKELKQDGTL